MPTHVLLGRSSGLRDEQMAHVGDDPLPAGLFNSREAAIVRYAQTSARGKPIDDEFYDELRSHFTTKQLIEICFIVGFANLINRFHATFHTDVDDETQERLAEACPIRLPAPPTAATAPV